MNYIPSRTWQVKHWLYHEQVALKYAEWYLRPVSGTWSLILSPYLYFSHIRNWQDVYSNFFTDVLSTFAWRIFSHEKVLTIEHMCIIRDGRFTEELPSSCPFYWNLNKEIRSQMIILEDSAGDKLCNKLAEDVCIQITQRGGKMFADPLSPVHCIFEKNNDIFLELNWNTYTHWKKRATA